MDRGREGGRIKGGRKKERKEGNNYRIYEERKRGREEGRKDIRWDGCQG